MTEVSLASLARNFGWVVEDENAVHSAEDALRRGGNVGLYVDGGEAKDLLWGATGRVEMVEDLGGFGRREFEAALIVTHRNVEADLKDLPFPVAVVRPRNLVVGLESKGDVTVEDISRSVSRGLRECGLAEASVAKFAALETDGGVAAFEGFARNSGVPLELHVEARLGEIFDPPAHAGSPRIEGLTAEAAAVLTASGHSGPSDLIAQRTRAGSIFLAVALIPPN